MKKLLFNGYKISLFIDSFSYLFQNSPLISSILLFNAQFIKAITYRLVINSRNFFLKDISFRHTQFAKQFLSK